VKLRRVVYLAFVTCVDCLVMSLSGRVSFLCCLFFPVTFFVSTYIQWGEGGTVEKKDVTRQNELDS